MSFIPGMNNLSGGKKTSHFGIFFGASTKIS